VFFIKKFLAALEDRETKVLVIDEAGFGTDHLRKYGLL